MIGYGDSDNEMDEKGMQKSLPFTCVEAVSKDKKYMRIKHPHKNGLLRTTATILPSRAGGQVIRFRELESPKLNLI